jgi:hypothetical protein
MNDCIGPAPYPCRADGQVDGHCRADAEEIRHQIKEAEANENPHYYDVHCQRDHGREVELDESS